MARFPSSLSSFFVSFLLKLLRWFTKSNVSDEFRSKQFPQFLRFQLSISPSRMLISIYSQSDRAEFIALTEITRMAQTEGMFESDHTGKPMIGS